MRRLPQGIPSRAPAANRRGRAFAQLRQARDSRRRRLISRVPMVVLTMAVVAAATAGAVGSPRGGSGSGAPAGRLISAAQVRALGLFGTKAWTPIKPIDSKTLYAGPSPAAPAAVPAAPTAVNAGSIHPTTPAPPGFRQQVVEVYANAVQVADSVDSNGAGGSVLAISPMPPTGEFDRALATLTPDQLSELYDAFLKVHGGFSSFADALGHSAVAALAPPSTTVALPSTLSVPGLTAHASGSGNTFPPATTETTDPAGNAANCPASAPGGNDGDDGIYAATLAVDIATVAAAVVPQSLVLGAYVLGEGATFTIPDPVNIVVQVLIGAGQIVRDTLIWLHQINGDCTAIAQEEQVNVIFDNVNSLTTLVDSRTTGINNEEQLLYALVDSRNTLILNKIAAIQASLNLELKITIENDLLQGTSGAVADLEVPTSDGGYLNATPIGVQELVTAALGEEQTAGQAVNPAAPQDLASANADLAAQNYKAAFTLYGQTYREIVGG
ncbi:MAG TPA: hypothetical protein VND67_02410 [Acidimicrobiales bacterium]|nr:hypothetical protein [Acidimicrobiales bacterium]